VIDRRPLVEADAAAVVAAFRGLVGWLVVLSSGDVYRAYGRLPSVSEAAHLVASITLHS
jgi:hypothetical protein